MSLYVLDTDILSLYQSSNSAVANRVFQHSPYEHLNIHGQGNEGEAIYATTAISGSTNPTHFPCFSEIDHALLYALESDTERH